MVIEEQPVSLTTTNRAVPYREQSDLVDANVFFAIYDLDQSAYFGKKTTRLNFSYPDILHCTAHLHKTNTITTKHSLV